MMPDNATIVRKRIILVSIALIAVIASTSVFYWLYTNGRLSIEVNNLKIEPTITVKDTAGRTLYAHKGYSFSKTLPAGDYVVNVISGINSSDKSVTVGNFLKETHDSIEVVDSLFTKPLTNTPVYKPQITKDKLLFIDTVVWMLGEYRGSELTYYNTPNVTDVAWVDDSSGYIITQSYSERLVRFGLLDNRSIRYISLPKETTEPVSIYYSKGDDTLYLVIEDQLYSYNGNSFDNLYAVDRGSIITFANNSLIGLTNTPSDTFENKDTILKIYNLKGDIKFEKNLGTSETVNFWSSASLSEDGSLLAVGEQGKVIIYNSENFSEVYSLPANDISALTWDKKSPIYATGNMLWRYSYEQKLSQSITELLPYMNISEVLYADGEIYLVNQKTDTTSLLKVAKDSTEIADILDGLEMTFVEPGCYLNYFDIDKPRIFIHQESNDISRCIDPLNNVLRSVGLNPDEILITKSDGSYNPY